MLKFVITAVVCIAAVAVVLTSGARAADASHRKQPAKTRVTETPVPATEQIDAVAPHATDQTAAESHAEEPYGVRLPVVTPTMRRYSRIRWTLYFVGTAYYLLLLWIVLRTGLSARMRKVADRAGRPLLLRVLVYYLLFTAVMTVASFPLDFYSDYWLEHSYGLSAQPFSAWIGDSAKGLGVGIVTMVPVFWLVYWLMGRFPGRWPFVLWAACIPIIAAAIFAQPLIVDPMFNKFTPLPASPLRDRIHGLAVQAGIPNAPILVSDVSKQTNTTNAYVNGIGSSARIVLWDTLLKGKNKMPDDQILSIVGHEMGHYVLKHIYWGFLEAVGGLFFVLPILKWGYETVVWRSGKTWKLEGPQDLASIPALLLTFSVISFLSSPVVNGLSRHVEHQADEYGLNVTRNPKAMAEAFVALTEQNLSDPDPPKFITLWLGSHPPLKERIEYALSYCPKYGCSDK